MQNGWMLVELLENKLGWVPYNRLLLKPKFSPEVKFKFRRIIISKIVIFEELQKLIQNYQKCCLKSPS